MKRQHDLTVRLRAHEMFARGVDSQEVAATLGVNISTVRNWKRAGHCADCGSPVGDAGTGRCIPCAKSAAVVWTRELIIERIHEYVERYGRTPRAADWNPQLAIAHGHPEIAAAFYKDLYWPFQCTVAARFGSFNAGVEAAGYTPRASGHRIGMRTWPRAAIIRAIQDWADVHGDVPSARGWAPATLTHPCASQVERVFGSWNAGIRAAGFEARSSGGQRQAVAA